MIPTYEQFLKYYVQIAGEDLPDFLRRFFRSKDKLHLFGRFFFDHIIKGDYETPEAHRLLLQEITNRKTSAIIYPRGFAKTTWERIDTLHDIVYALEPVIMYVSSTQTDAQFHFESIKFELENNDLLRQIYGDLVPNSSDFSRKWSNTHFETSNRVNLLARGACKGRGVNIKNQRPTKIILDDIEEDEAVRSPERRAKLHSWLMRVIIPSLDKDRGYCKMIGTVLSEQCELLKFYKNYGGLFKKCNDESGHSIWPQKWSDEDLLAKREEIGLFAFSSEFLNTPVNEETAIIQRAWIENNKYEQLKDTTMMRTVIMFDPQNGEGESADYYGLCVVGFFPKERHRYVLKILTGRDTQRNQAALFVRTCQEFPNSIAAGIEKIITQVAVYQLVLEWIAGNIDLPDVNNDNRNVSVIPVTPEGKDKKARLEMHQAAFERGEVHLHHTMKNLEDQLVSFPQVDHDDDVDATVYCLEWANRKAGSIVKVEEKRQNEVDRFAEIGKPIGDIMKQKF